MYCEKCGTKRKDSTEECPVCNKSDGNTKENDIVVFSKIGGNRIENIAKPSILQVIALFFIEIGILLLISLILKYLPKEYLKVYFLFAEIPLVIPIFVMIKMYKFETKKLLRFNKTGFLNWFIVFFIGFLSIFIAVFINIIYMFFFKGILGKMDTPTINVQEIELIAFFIISVALSPAICEEIIFRGFIQRGFERLGGILAAVITGILFGLIHFNFVQLPALVFLGIIAGLAVYITNSLYMGMFIHFINNAYSVIMVYLTRNTKTGNLETTINKIDISTIIVVAMVIIVLSTIVAALFVALHLYNKRYVRKKFKNAEIHLK